MIATIIICAGLACAVFFAVRHMVRDKKAGRGLFGCSCGSSCGSCGGSCDACSACGQRSQEHSAQ